MALAPPPLPPSAEPARTGITAPRPVGPQRRHQDSSTAEAGQPRPMIQRISTTRYMEQLNNPPLPFAPSSTTGSRLRENRGAVGPRRRPLEYDEAFPRQQLNHGDGVHGMDPRRYHVPSESHGEFSENGMHPGREWESRHFPPPLNHFPLRQSSVLSNRCSGDGGGFAYDVDSPLRPSSFLVQPSSYRQNRLPEEPRETLVHTTTVAVASSPPQPAASSGGIESRSTGSTARSRPHCDALAIDVPTFSYHDSFLSRLLSRFIQKLPDELEAVRNKTKKPRKMNWYVQYAKRIERVCQPYARVKVQNLKAVVTVQDREWLSLEGSSSVALYTEVIKRMRAEAIAWRELKSEVEEALIRCRDRSGDDGSRAFLSAWRKLKKQQGNATRQEESMSPALQGNYFHGTRLHHWNFVVGKVEIGSGSHEENREAYRLAAVSAISWRYARAAPTTAPSSIGACFSPNSEPFLVEEAANLEPSRQSSNLKGFMIQGGDPTGTGKGGQSIWGGAFDDEFHPQNRHNCRGIVSMANSGPNTNKQQFFITYAKQPHLNNVYTVFGKYVHTSFRRVCGWLADSILTINTLLPLLRPRVIDGLDTLDAMEKTPVDAKNRPLKEILLTSVTIHANPIADM
ncbi:hypothetical protein BBJ28_00021342 [Nothophytophthora sp. Chile5]|nr:hypothetical protein BBJ28_00021342 [Nothophytophthora sp. Chile5]